MDILTFGAPRIIRNLSSRKKTVIEINLEEILKKLNLTYNEFIDLCILLGCDYCPTIQGIGMKKAYQIIQKYKSIEKFIECIGDVNLNQEFSENNYKVNLQLPDNYNYQETKKYFLNPEVHSSDIKFMWTEPKYDEIFKFMVELFGFNK